MTGPSAPVGRWRGSAAEFHAREVAAGAGPELWWFEVDRPALVLGSTQRPELVDARSATAAGVEVVRRRSGGGAVLLEPGACTWIDVVLPRVDPRWSDDVGRSGAWLGAAWSEALGSLGLPTGAVHAGALVRRRWSDLVCFGGVGPGEVLVDGRKLVGISQRRTRHHARFQCAVLHRWDPGAIVALLDLTEAERADAAAALAPAAVGLDELVGAEVAPPTPDEVVGALAAAVAADPGHR